MAADFTKLAKGLEFFAHACILYEYDHSKRQHSTVTLYWQHAATRRHERKRRWTGSREARQPLNRRSIVIPAEVLNDLQLDADKSFWGRHSWHCTSVPIDC